MKDEVMLHKIAVAKKMAEMEEELKKEAKAREVGLEAMFNHPDFQNLSRRARKAATMTLIYLMDEYNNETSERKIKHELH